MNDTTCPDCGAKMIFKTEGLKYFWVCTKSGCKGKVLAKHDGRLAATPADIDTRRLRWLGHQVFDLLWGFSGSPMRRQEAQAWLAKQMKIPLHDCHFGVWDASRCGIAIRLIMQHWGRCLAKTFPDKRDIFASAAALA